MIKIKSLLPFLADIDGKQIFFYLNQDDLTIHTFEKIEDDLKESLLEELKLQIFANQSVNPSLDLQTANELKAEFDDMRETYDYRESEFPNIQ